MGQAHDSNEQLASWQEVRYIDMTTRDQTGARERKGDGYGLDR